MINKQNQYIVRDTFAMKTIGVVYSDSPETALALITQVLLEAGDHEEGDILSDIEVRPGKMFILHQTDVPTIDKLQKLPGFELIKLIDDMLKTRLNPAELSVLLEAYRRIGPFSLSAPSENTVEKEVEFLEKLETS